LPVKAAAVVPIVAAVTGSMVPSMNLKFDIAVIPVRLTTVVGRGVTTLEV
jgi:hypothetical protein